ncbi:MAG: hypothetical protein WB789_08000 [Thermoplasmata archaeon]
MPSRPVRSMEMGTLRSPPVLAPPEEFDAFVVWLAEVSDRLVLLEEFSLKEIRSAMRITRERVLAHLRSSDRSESSPGSTPRTQELDEIVRSDHEWFEMSLAELAGLVRIVEQEDHGGHRQALGQYGRLLATALTRHRRDEAELERLRLFAGTRPLRNPN